MNEKYFSYLLRLWCSGQRGYTPWQASLEDPHTHQIVSFRSLDNLFSFLLDLIQSASDPSSSQSQVTPGNQNDCADP